MPGEQETIAKMRQMPQEGLSYDAIAKAPSDAGIAPRTTSRAGKQTKGTGSGPADIGSDLDGTRQVRAAGTKIRLPMRIGGSRLLAQHPAHGFRVKPHRAAPLGMGGTAPVPERLAQLLH